MHHPELRLAALTASAAMSRRESSFRAAFTGLPDAMADALGKAVLAILDTPATAAAWGWAASRVPWSTWRHACAEWQAHLDQQRAAFAPPRAKDERRSKLCRFAFQLLRSGPTAQGFAARMRKANASLVEPLPAEEFDRLATWCVRQHKSQGAAGRTNTRAAA